MVERTIRLKFPQRNAGFYRISGRLSSDRVWWLCLRADGLEQVECFLLLGVGGGSL